MNTIAQTQAGTMSGYAAPSAGTQAAKTEKDSQASGTAAEKKTSRVTSGRTIGQPELSDKAMKYYEQLKKKYSNMDFILVSSDMKQQAQANAGKFANPNRMVVLIDEEKIERMAEDEAYRNVYEGKISSASSKLPELSKSLGNNSAVKGFGMQVNSNGTTSFFAVVDKSLAAQKKRLDKKAEQKAEAKKKDKKAQEKKRAEEAHTQKAEDEKKASMKEDENLVTITASSQEELLRKINDMMFSYRSDNIFSDKERQVGWNFDAAW